MPVRVHDHDDAAETTLFPRRRWYLFILFCAGVLNLFDRQIINILAQDIRADLHLNDTELGLLTGTAFALFYAAFGIPLGRLADRFDRTKILALALAAWSFFTMACGFGTNFVQLFAARIGVGVGEAGSQPASTALIPDIFPAGRRNAAMSLMLVGASLGSFLGLLIGGQLASTWGWRAAFAIAGIPGLLLALVVATTMTDPRKRARTDSQSGIVAALGAISAVPAFRRYVVLHICGAFLTYASGAWLPALLIRVHHLSVAEAGVVSAIAIGVGGAIGTLGGGFLSDRVGRKMANGEISIVRGSFLLTLPTLAIVVLAQDKMVAAIGCFFFSVAAYAWLAPTISLVQKSVGPESRALSTGTSGAIANILSLGVGVPAVGALSDILGRSGSGGAGLGYALSAGVFLVVLAGLSASYGTFRRSAGRQNRPAE